MTTKKFLSISLLFSSIAAVAQEPAKTLDFFANFEKEFNSFQNTTCSGCEAFALNLFLVVGKEKLKEEEPNYTNIAPIVKEVLQQSSSTNAVKACAKAHGTFAKFLEAVAKRAHKEKHEYISSALYEYIAKDDLAMAEQNFAEYNENKSVEYLRTSIKMRSSQMPVNDENLKDFLEKAFVNNETLKGRIEQVAKSQAKSVDDMLKKVLEVEKTKVDGEAHTVELIKVHMKK